MLGWREQVTARRGGMRSRMVKVGIGKAVQWRAGPARAGQARNAGANLAHRIRQRDQIVLIGIGG